MASLPRSVPNLVEFLHSRRCVANSTSVLELNKFLSQSRTFYAGFDPTADSLHVGHLSVLMTMKRLQQLHHKPIVLIGGATGMIGDPSGRDSERPLIPVEEIESNVLSLTSQIKRFLDFSPELSCRAEAVNNLDWYNQTSIIAFLRDIGKHFKISSMLSRDSVKSRLNSPSGLTFTEFAYQSLQASDFLTLARTKDCLLQIGGADQWGNIVSGINLIRDKTSQRAHGLTVPLLTAKSGTKLGKSTGGGSVWLCPKKTSPYSLYQYLLKTDDNHVYNLLRTLTMFSIEEIVSFKVIEAQRKLAESVTETVHGKQGLQQAQESTENVFGQGKVDSKHLQGVPEIYIGKNDFIQRDLASLLQLAGIVTSRSEGRRLVLGGGISINGIKETDPKRQMCVADLRKSICLIQSGKKRCTIVRTYAVEPELSNEIKSEAK